MIVLSYGQYTHHVTTPRWRMAGPGPISAMKHGRATRRRGSPLVIPFHHIHKRGDNKPPRTASHARDDLHDSHGALADGDGLLGTGGAQEGQRWVEHFLLGGEGREEADVRAWLGLGLVLGIRANPMLTLTLTLTLRP